MRFALAQHVVDAQAVPLLVLCIQEPEITLKRDSASSMGDICKHSPELARYVVDAGAVAYPGPSNPPPRRQIEATGVWSWLTHISKHSVDLAEVVVEAEIFPNILNCLKDSVMVRKNAAMCIREVSKHTPELTKLAVNSGGAAALVDYISEAMGNGKHCYRGTGYISAFSETLALAAIVSKGIAPLKDALVSNLKTISRLPVPGLLAKLSVHPDRMPAPWLRETCCVTVGVRGARKESSEDLKTKSKRALKTILAKCTHLQGPSALLRDQPCQGAEVRAAPVRTTAALTTWRLGASCRAVVYNSYKSSMRLLVASS